MVNGKCYTMNPDRGSAPTWINNNANDTWWWVTTPCIGVITKGSAIALERSANIYQVYDMQGKLFATSAYQPRNLPTGRWLVLSRDTQGDILESKVIDTRH